MGWDESNRKMLATQRANKATDNAWKLIKELSLTIEEKRWVIAVVCLGSFTARRILRDSGRELDTLTEGQANRLHYQLIKVEPFGMETALCAIASLRKHGRELPTI